MREIKFRAWDKKEKKMWIWEIIERNKVFALDSNAIHHADDSIVIPNDEDIVLMQFTGLKDRDGVDIYEGDIIESGVSKELSLKGHRGYVVFEDASFTVERRQHKVPYNHDKYLPYLDWPCEAFESCKVIGNVFEDGELLKE